jgi:hypothetical protein
LQRIFISFGIIRFFMSPPELVENFIVPLSLSKGGA